METEKRNFPEESEIDINVKGGSFKEIIMIHLARIALLSSTELRGGYFSITQTKSGDTKEVYVADSRESLSNAVYFLAQALFPKFDKDMKSAFKTFKEATEKLKDEFLEETEKEDSEVLGEAYYPEKEKSMLEEYKIKKLDLYRELFTDLSQFLSRKKYLEIVGGAF